MSRLQKNITLDKIYRLKNQRIKFILNMVTNEIADFSNYLINIVINETNAPQKKLLSTFKIIENTIEIIIPFKEIIKIKDGSFLSLAVQSKKGVMHIEILNKLNKKFSLSFGGETFLISETSEHVIINRKSSDETRIEANSIQSFKEKRFVISGTFYTRHSVGNELKIKGFYIKNIDTSEKLSFNDFNINYADHKFDLEIDLSEHLLYEGDWELFSLMSINNVDEDVKIYNLNEQMNIQGDYLKYNSSLYFYEVYENKSSQVTIHIKKNRQQFILVDIKGVQLEKNILSIQGNLQICLMASKDDSVTEIVLMNRTTKEQIRRKIEVANDGAFITQILCNDEVEGDIFKEEGIWDAFVLLQIKGIPELVRIKINSDQKRDEFKSFSKPIFNQRSGIIRNIRSYITVDDNLSFQVTKDILTCEIQKIEFDNGKTYVYGFVFNNYLDFALKNIHLQKLDREDKIICTNEFRKENDVVYFTSVIDWQTLNINENYDTDYQFILTILINGKEYPLELVSNFDNIRNKSNIIVYPPFNVTCNEYPLQVRHFYSNKNVLSVFLGNSINAYCTDLKKGHKEIALNIVANIEKEPLNSNDVELVLKSKNTNQELAIKADIDNKSNNYLFRINESLVTKLKTTIGNFEVNFAVTINNQKVMTRIKSLDSNITMKNSTFKINAIKMTDNLFLSLYFDSRNQHCFFEIRKLNANEKVKEKVKFFFAKCLAKMVKRFSRKPVWLIGENLGEIAQDNGFAFFQYCTENKENEKYYYVSKENNKNADNLIPYSQNILRYDSFKHYFLYWRSQYLIVSHGIRDVIPSIVHNKMNSNPKRIIYLQHGIIAMKKLKFNKDSYNGMIKKFVVSSVHEKNILIKMMNFNPKQIIVTGLPRFDTLIDKSKDKEVKEILLMPTWREWIIDGSGTDFLTSDFYLHYIDLLRDHRLHEILEKHNLILKFVPHIEIQRKYMEYFTSLNKRIKVVKTGEQSVKDLIQESTLLITDYSSVVFDFNYVKKPIIFYQFDLHEYLKRRGSYIDLTNDLIGDIAYTKEELLNQIKDSIANDFNYRPIYSAKSKKFYSYHDQQNSKRIYQEIKKIKNN